jgi:hypothetical protein
MCLFQLAVCISEIIFHWCWFLNLLIVSGAESVSVLQLLLCFICCNNNYCYSSRKISVPGNCSRFCTSEQIAQQHAEYRYLMDLIIYVFDGSEDIQGGWLVEAT